MAKILVTGGSGFVGSHIILQALAAGHQVTATVRSPEKADAVRARLASAGADNPECLRFVTADLRHDGGWADAAASQDHVLHVASPFPLDNPRHEDALIVPARDGTLRVLRAARDAGAGRVVLTSSIAAIVYGHDDRAGPFTEADWTDVAAPETQAYAKSKTLAERAAWDFVAREGGGLELVVINPAGIFGPALDDDLSGTIELVRQMLRGAMPGLPDLYFGIVDVRDVADLHLRAMTHPAAAGERFIAVAGTSFSLSQIADVLRARLGDAATRIPRRELADWMVRLVALFDRRARAIVPALGKRKSTSSAKARALLGWSARSSEDAIGASGESLVRLGLA